MTNKARKRLGKAGEDRAVAFLQQKGYTVLARNWRCQLGEIDIVALHRNELVIIEVRSRRGKGAGEFALESITPAKQARLSQLAQTYYAELDRDDLGIRIDVVTVAVEGGNFIVEVYENVVGE